MEAVVKRKVTAEFRVEAVKLVNEQGFTQADVARRLNLPYQTLYNWMQLAKAGKLATVDAKRISVRGRPPVLAKQSVVPVQLSTGIGGQFYAGVNTLVPRGLRHHNCG